MKNIIYKILSSIRQQWSSPKVYALVVKVKSFQVLSLQSAFSLEEAFMKAKKAIKKDIVSGISQTDIDISKIEMFQISEIDDLFEEFYEKKISETNEELQLNPLEKKNILMKRIVEGKDSKLLEENRSVFSKAEVEYLTEEINKK